MPRAILKRDRVEALLPRPLTDREFEELLFASKAEIDALDPESVTISVTPDRLDLLSEGGLALWLQGALGSARGLPPIHRSSAVEEGLQFEVDASVGQLRPILSGYAVVAPTDAGLDAGTLEEAIRFQELLHASVGRDRRVASLGLYPLDRLRPPIRYALDPIAEVRFVPLDGTDEVGGAEFFERHPMAARYGPYGRLGDRCLTLRDDADEILSLPPVLNGRAGGEARVGDRRLLLESTGLRERAVRDALGLWSVVFASRGWRLEPVPVVGEVGAVGDGAAVVADRSIDLPTAVLRELTGEAYPAPEVEHRVARARLVAHPRAGGWTIEAPPWRPDLLAAVDVAEDVILASPVRIEDAVVPPSATRGRRTAAANLRRRFGTALLGLGLAQTYTSVLVSDEAVQRVAGARPIRLANPVSAEYSHVRDRLLLSHLEVLRRNTRRGYPQSIGEVGPVIVRDPAAESGASTRYHAGALLAGERIGFADVASLLDALLRTVDVGSIREPAEFPGTIAGRAARVRVAGEVVAELGEIHPETLESTGVPVPVAWAELDLTALGPLAGLREAP